MLSEGFLQQLRDKNDIEDTISRYVELKRAGKNIKGLCPFHSEKSASFTVFPETQSFFCFGCSAGGDVITFTKRMENLDYMDAVRLLADRAGLEIPTDNIGDQTHKLRTRIYEMNTLAARFFHNNLKTDSAKEAKAYINKRALTTDTVIKFGLGFALDEWDSLIKLLKSKGFNLEEMVAAGLVVKNAKGSYYDRFRNKLMFPIIDLKAKVIGFGGRVLDDSKPKYINSPETLVFKKGSNLFALGQSKNDITDKIILAEGYMDVIAIHQAGIKIAVATLGTAITTDQARLLSRYCKQVIIAYDSDQAGKLATNKAIKLLNEVGVTVKVLNIVGGKDPDEYIRTYGVEKFNILLNKSGNYVEHKIDELKIKYNLALPEEMVLFMKDATIIFSDIKNDVEREIYINKIAEDLNISKENFLREVESFRKKKYKKETSIKFRAETDRIISKNDKVNVERGDNLKGARAEERLIGILFANKDFINQLIEHINVDENFVTEFNKTIMNAIISRVIEDKDVELINLSGELNDNQMSKLSEIITNNIKLGNGDITEALELIDVIKKEKNLISPKDTREMTSSEFLESIQKLRK